MLLAWKRWLRPEQSELLTRLLRERRLNITIAKMWRPYASLSDALEMALNPDVDFEWLLALRDRQILHFKTNPSLVPDYFTGFVDDFLCTAIKRPNISAEMLDRLCDGFARKLSDKVGRVAFESQNIEVLKWAIGKGLAPTSEQLKEYYSYPME